MKNPTFFARIDFQKMFIKTPNMKSVWKNTLT